MSQHDLEIDNQTFPATRGDINDALQALGSNSSGLTEPLTTFANMFWVDVRGDLDEDNAILKIRSEADDAWISIGYLDQSTNEFKIFDDTVVVDDSGRSNWFNRGSGYI